jgi:phosphatidylinositol alpha-1,6-mannosyltransferase
MPFVIEAAGQPRCLLVAQTFPPMLGGSATVYAALAREARGAIAVLTGARDHRTGAEWPGWRALDAAQPYPVTRIGLVRPPLAEAAAGGRWASRIRWGFGALRLAAAVARAAARHRADAVCLCDDETVGWLVPFTRHVLRRRALIYCHGDDLVQQDPRAIAARRRRFLQADRVVAAGEFAARRLAEGYGVPPGRIALVPNGVDLARFVPGPADAALAARLGIPSGRPVVLAPTRLVPRKGMDRLIEAWPAVRARMPGAALVVAGEGPQRPALEAMADEGVHLIGAVAAVEMPGLYRLADLVALPNRAAPGEADGLPLVLLEAMASGVPVLAGRAGGTAEAVRDGETGLLVDGEDIAAIAAAVLAVLTDPSLAARLAAGGLAEARRRGWPERARQFLALCGGGDG